LVGRLVVAFGGTAAAALLSIFLLEISSWLKRKTNDHTGLTHGSSPTEKRRHLVFRIQVFLPSTQWIAPAIDVLQSSVLPAVEGCSST
jgi:hypothetical protein